MTKTFRDLGVDAALCDALEAKSIIHPFPIQELTLPLALGRNDLIGQARTGTGKTLAFGLPLLQQVDADEAVTQALVVVPTRELCQQVHDDLTIGEARGLTTISVYGGVGFEEQTAALRGGVHVVVGTPGRLLDHLKRGNLDLSQVKVLVLDEADEMLDMGFLPDVERLIEACPAEGRHTMLFSATMPTAIVKMARRYLHHPTFTRADSEEHETAPNVAQHFFSVHRMDKPRVLARILQTPERGRCYVFVRTKSMADRLVTDLEDLRVPAIAIHGDLRQQTREKNLDRFRSGKADVLVATEVAARGIDVSGVTHVVNYDCPDDEKMYLHRIGRTARAGAAGVAVTFAEFNEADRLNVIRKAVGATDTEVHQVFSTSPLLTELFGLPDEKPWDHLSKRSRDGDGRDQRDERRSGPRKGRSDGRPKSRRDSEGAGRDRDAARTRTRREGVAEAPSEDDRPTRDGGTSRGRTGGRDRDGGRDRGGAGDRDGGRDREGARDRDGGRDRDRDTAASNGRTRTRTRTRDRAPAGDRRDDTRDGDQGRATGRTRARAGASTKVEDRDRAEDGPRRDRATGDDGGREAPAHRTKKSGGRNKQRSDRSGDGASDRRNGRGERGESGRDDRGGRSGGGQKSSRGGRGKGSQRAGRDESGGRGEQPTVRVARRGADARGQGEPQLARRVKVEHLP
ncbi:DEAD/DEAH box helicase [Egicoccus sp. AB-alg2]|uniref:DEAD/DEAH box helicase n=1 Tax=Egicoccus sp. AB-alg2 TaxID=3242693 RepID=UPI00359E42C1